LGFGIERDTFDAIKRAAPTTRYLALERIGGELTKMFMAPYAAIGFTAMLDADLFEPALHISDSTNLRHGIRVIAAAHTMDAVDYAAALLHHVDRLSAQGIYEMLLSVGIGADAADAVGRRAGIALGELPRDEVARMRMVGRHGPDTFFAGLSLRRACSIDRRESTADVDALVTHIRALLKSGCPFTLRQLAINGDDLATIGIKAGPKVGRILETLLDEVIVSKTPNERRALLDRARLINAD
jgi:tRNA nucleotidyltransferase (CCA-adding enzyme)